MKEGTEATKEAPTSLECIIKEISEPTTIDPGEGIQNKGVKATPPTLVDVGVAEVVLAIEVEMDPPVLMEIKVVLVILETIPPTHPLVIAEEEVQVAELLVLALSIESAIIR